MNSYKNLNEAQADQLDRAWDVFSAFGYCVGAEPIEGSEQLFVDTISAGAAELLRLADWVRTTYGYRGMSKNVIDATRDFFNPKASNFMVM
jgi:hypothetical protein